MSVIAPPEPPPEVQRPYDLGSEPVAMRVTKYRDWTRARQLAHLSLIGTAVVVATVIGAVGGEPAWERSPGLLVAQAVVLAIAIALLEWFWQGRGLRRRVAEAEPLPDSAHEVRMRLLGALLAPPVLLGGAGLGALFGIADVILGGDGSRSTVAVLVGLGAGRIVGLELTLRLIVERSDPRRTYFISLQDEEPEPLLWRLTPPTPSPSGSEPIGRYEIDGSSD